MSMGYQSQSPPGALGKGLPSTTAPITIEGSMEGYQSASLGKSLKTAGRTVRSNHWKYIYTFIRVDIWIFFFWMLMRVNILLWIIWGC